MHALPRLPRPYSLEGRAGALLSVGLLRTVPLAAMQDCVYRQWASGVALASHSPLLLPTGAHMHLDTAWHPKCLCSPLTIWELEGTECGGNGRGNPMPERRLIWTFVLRAAPGGDAMLTACLWEVAGAAPTAPKPLWPPDALSAFDASSPLLPDPFDGSRRAGRGVPVKVSRALGNLLSAAVGACNALCQVPGPAAL